MNNAALWLLLGGYVAMLKDGSYGTMPDKANEPLDQIHESAKLMTLSIEDFLGGVTH